MIELLWFDVVALTIASGIAVLDVDVQWRTHRLGRPLYGAMVLAGLFLLYTFVVQHGYVPIPGMLLGLFAFLFLPFLSSAFIDLETTDPQARVELEALLLNCEFRQLVNASDERVVKVGRRRLRLHWEGRQEAGDLVLELDVHPSLMPVTISRPHVALVSDQRHLERIREDIRRLRRTGEGPEPA